MFIISEQILYTTLSKKQNYRQNKLYLGNIFNFKHSHGPDTFPKHLM